MGKIKRFWSNVRALPKRMNLKEATPTDFVGRTILAQTDFDAPFEEVVISDVRGCLGLGNMPEAERSRLIKSFQINGTHLVGIFSFYTQLQEGRLPTEEEEAEFQLATQIEKIRPLKGK